MRHVHSAIRGFCALLPALLVLNGCARTRALPAQPGPARQPVDLKQAQGMVDFVIYAPAYLPQGAAVGQALVVPEQMVGKYLLPNEIALELGAGLSLWEMPDGALPLSPTGAPVRLSGQTGWLSTGSGLGRRTVEWEVAGTRIGLSGNVEPSLLLRIANSFEPAHPEVAPRPVSERRARIAPGLGTPLPPGGIGAQVAPGPKAIVAAVYPGTAADRAGIEPGDEIVAVDGRVLADERAEEAVRLVRGPIGSRAALKVKPRGQSRLRTVTLRRAAVPVQHRIQVTVGEAQAQVAYPVLAPSYLPSGFSQAEVTLGTWVPNPAALEPDLQIHCDGPQRAVLIIAQRPATATWPPWPTPPRSAPARVGSSAGVIAENRTGALLLQWRAETTAIRLFAMGVPRSQVMRVAESMRPPARAEEPGPGPGAQAGK